MQRFNEDGRLLCARPTCTRLARTAGYCAPHAEFFDATRRFVPAGTVKKIIQEYVDGGASWQDICESSGVDMKTIRRIMTGESKMCRRETVDALRNHPPQLTQPFVWPLTRRVQALRALGFTMDELEDGSGVSRSVLYVICMRPDRAKRAHRDTDEKIREFYAAHQFDPARPEHPRVAQHMWPAPLDWDDIDDPDERAMASRFVYESPGKSERCMRGHLYHARNVYPSLIKRGTVQWKACSQAMKRIRTHKLTPTEDLVQEIADELYNDFMSGVAA